MALSRLLMKHRTATCSHVSEQFADSLHWTWVSLFRPCICVTTCSSNRGSTQYLLKATKWQGQKSSSTISLQWTRAMRAIPLKVLKPANRHLTCQLSGYRKHKKKKPYSQGIPLLTHPRLLQRTLPKYSNAASQTSLAVRKFSLFWITLPSMLQKLWKNWYQTYLHWAQYRKFCRTSYEKIFRSATCSLLLKLSRTTEQALKTQMYSQSMSANA